MSNYILCKPWQISMASWAAKVSPSAKDMMIKKLTSVPGSIKPMINTLYPLKLLQHNLL